MRTPFFPLFILACLWVHAKAAPMNAPPPPPAPPPPGIDTPPPTPPGGHPTMGQSYVDAARTQARINRENYDATLRMDASDKHMYKKALRHSMEDAHSYISLHDGKWEDAHRAIRDEHNRVLDEMAENGDWDDNEHAHKSIRYHSHRAEVHEQLRQESIITDAHENAKRMRQLHAAGQLKDPEDKKLHELALRRAKVEAFRHLAEHPELNGSHYPDIHRGLRLNHLKVPHEMLQNHSINREAVKLHMHMAEVHDQLATGEAKPAPAPRRANTVP